MQREEAGEEPRLELQHTDRSMTKSLPAVQQQHQLGHEFRTPANPAMLRLVAAEIPLGQALGEGERLLEQQAQSIACDRVHRSRRIAHQRDIAARDRVQSARHGDAAALPTE